MRLLVLTSSYPTSHHPVASAFLEDWVGALTRRGHDVTVSAPGDRSPQPDAGLNQIPTVSSFQYLPWPCLQTLAYGAGMYENVRCNPVRLLQVPSFLWGQYHDARVLAGRADLVHAHWLFPAGIVGALLKHRTGLPLVVTVHSTDLHVLRMVPGGRALARFVASQADRLHFVSHYHRGLFEGWLGSGSASSSYVAPMGIPEAFIDHPPAALRGVPRIGFMGRLIPLKGIDRLLRACAALGLSEVYVAGEGPTRTELQNLSQSLGLDVRFVGPVAGANKMRFLDSCDLLVFPSRDYHKRRGEGLPVSLLEGLARGRVAVASDSGGIPDVIRHGENGYLFSAEREQDLRDTLGHVVRTWPVSRLVGARARQSVLEYSASAIGRLHELAYIDVANGAPWARPGA